jgi:hypothetical protein
MSDTTFKTLQLLIDKPSSGVIVYMNLDGPRCYTPEVSEDLVSLIYWNQAPSDFNYFNVMKFKFVNGEVVRIPDPSIISASEWERLTLLRRKVLAMVYVNARVTYIRMKGYKSIVLQNETYQIKYQQAVSFRNAGYNDEQLSKFPFIEQAARLGNLTYKQAADIIIFNREEIENTLLATEELRMSTNNQILECTTVSQVEQLLENLRATMFMPLFWVK